MLFAILNCPPNFFWWMWLEDRFPARTKSSGPVTESPSTKPALNTRNTAIRFVLAQTLGAAVDKFIFLGDVSLLQDQPWDEAVRQCKEGFWPLIFAGQELWPFVNIAMFTFVPTMLRTVVGSIVGMFLNIHLTLVRRSGKAATEREGTQIRHRGREQAFLLFLNRTAVE